MPDLCNFNKDMYCIILFKIKVQLNLIALCASDVTSRGKQFTSTLQLVITFYVVQTPELESYFAGEVAEEHLS